MFHATSRRHLVLQHISPRTTIFYIWDHITLQSASVPPFHTTTSRLKHMPFHITQTVHILHGSPFHIHNYSTPHPHSTSQHISHHTIFHIALHHTRFHIVLHHHIWHHNTLHNFPHMTSHYIIFHIWHHTTIAQHIAYHHNSTPPLTFHILHYGNLSTYQNTTFHTP